MSETTLSETAPSETAPFEEHRPQRADARRNHLRILEAAEAVFAEHGLMAPIDEVARRAGVGVGTVYRHFPTKDALFEAIVIERLDELLQRADALRAGAGADPGAAFFSFVTEVVILSSRYRDLAEEMSRIDADNPGFKADLKHRLDASVAELLAGAQGCGVVRGDIGPAEAALLMQGICAAACQAAPSSVDLMLAVLCDGLRVPTGP